MAKFYTGNTNIEPYWDLIKRIITESDIVLEILDARLVKLSRNEEVERLVKEIGRPLIFVVNKSDLADRNRLNEEIKKLNEKNNIVFVSNKNKISYKILLSEIRRLFKKCGKREQIILGKYDKKPEYRECKADIVVGVLGYPNVGKSSVINGLAHRKKVKVSKKAGTTHGIHWIRISDDIKLIDSPGVIPLKKEDEVRYGLIGAKDNETLRDPELVSHAIIKLFLKENKKAFEKFYNISITNEEVRDENSYNIILKIADKKRFLLKGNNLDENRAYSLVIRDWQEGRLRL